jgi:hypothetical protein
MMKSKYALVSLLFMLSTIACSAQKPLDSLLGILKKPDFDKIYKVKDSIINYQALAVPKLIELLDDTSYVKLTNTADLMYPGATQFYGHWGSISYDLDYINVRVAWIMEQLTFRDFGYNTLGVNITRFLKFRREHLQDESLSVDLKNKKDQHQLAVYRLFLAAEVKDWWAKNSKDWSRFKAVKEALASTDVKRQVKALQYLRGRIQSKKNTRCDNLTTESFYTELHPLIEQIGKTNTEAKKEADFFLVYEKNVRF